MAKTVVDIYRKAVLDAGISGKNWQKNDAYDVFTTFFNEAYTTEQREQMKYEAILHIAKKWWDEMAARYS